MFLLTKAQILKSSPSHRVNIQVLSSQRLRRLHGGSALSVASTRLNRLWQEMAPAAVGSCIQVYGGSRGATGISFLLSKETGGGAPLPGGDSTNRAKHLAVILTFYLFLTSTDPLSGNSLLQSLHLLIVFSPQHSYVSDFVLRGNLLFPAGLFVPLLRWHPSRREGISLFCFSPTLQRVLPHVLTHVKGSERLRVHL